MQRRYKTMVRIGGKGMTEEIIVDGVDISGCDNLYEKDDMICVDNGIEESCQGNNCYYKQLKRLEQENKELKEQAQLDGECIDKLIEARDMYRSAVEEIREVLKDWDNHVYNPQDLVKRIDEVLK